MLETIGHVLLWVFAIFGAMMVAVMVGIACERENNKPEVKATPPMPPQPQITNLRTVRQPAPAVQPQMLTKTTMQITTTRYVDPSEGKKAVTDGS